MKINVIVCEYNPLHNGHVYLIEKSKEQNPDCYTVCIMSGNFMQRGEPALLHKWDRANWALDAGADIVLELPTFFALQTADKFALGAMKIASLLGADGNVYFGSENSDITVLKAIAKVTLPQNEQFKQILQSNLDDNQPFAVARQNAIVQCLHGQYDEESLKKTISASNCILAIEYIKALYLLDTPLSPVAVQRKSSLYNDTVLTGMYSSATSIREAIKKGEDVSHTVPSYVYETLAHSELSARNYFDNIILYKLRTMSKEDLADIMDVKEGLENLIQKAANAYNTLDEVIAYATNKRYTSARIRRICYCAMLDITKQKYSKYNEQFTPTYARVLGFKKEAQPLLKYITDNSSIPLITSIKDGLKINAIAPLLELDVKATDIYSLSLSNKNCTAAMDFTQKIISRGSFER